MTIFQAETSDFVKHMTENVTVFGYHMRREFVLSPSFPFQKDNRTFHLLFLKVFRIERHVIRICIKPTERLVLFRILCAPDLKLQRTDPALQVPNGAMDPPTGGHANNTGANNNDPDDPNNDENGVDDFDLLLADEVAAGNPNGGHSNGRNDTDESLLEIDPPVVGGSIDQSMTDDCATAQSNGDRVPVREHRPVSVIPTSNLPERRLAHSLWLLRATSQRSAAASTLTPAADSAFASDEC